ncbi:unnamed protein product [Phytophthora lilii]|uniref:Unnamed protein product n=1 Tax=Phytophthora lilii TaxID=2077276 RepID=A0A9W6TCG1_9STRA|nr:unnamed protein product [Phytophthora lilii]
MSGKNIQPTHLASITRSPGPVHFAEPGSPPFTIGYTPRIPQGMHSHSIFSNKILGSLLQSYKYAKYAFRQSPIKKKLSAMSSLRIATLMVVLVLVAGLANASNLRNGHFQQAASGSGSDDDLSAFDATQDATSVSSDSQTSDSVDQSSIIETQSSVQDASAPAAGDADGVKAWAQCGGLYYLGDTQCQQHTFCKKLSEFISVCFPESRPTEKVIRLEL